MNCHLALDDEDFEPYSMLWIRTSRIVGLGLWSMVPGPTRYGDNGSNASASDDHDTSVCEGFCNGGLSVSMKDWHRETVPLAVHLPRLP